MFFHFIPGDIRRFVDINIKLFIKFGSGQAGQLF
jgi:hypothetical protein